jgi:hypothetical protein
MITQFAERYNSNEAPFLPDSPSIKGCDVWNTLLTKSCSTNLAKFVLHSTQNGQFPEEGLKSLIRPWPVC